MKNFSIKNIFLIFALSISIDSQAASFDCAKAITKIENSICASSVLSKLDSELANIYDVEILVNPDSSGVKTAQRAWLRETRNKCPDENCLITAYQQRIAALLGPDPVDAPTREEMQSEDDVLSAEELTKQEADAEKNRIAQENVKKSQEDLLKAQAEFMAAADLEREKIAEERTKLKAQVDSKNTIEKNHIYSIFIALLFLALSFFVIKFSFKKIKNQIISRNSSVSSNKNTDDLIKDKKLDEDAEIKMKLEALRAERNKKIKSHQEELAKLKVEFNEELKSNTEKFKKYITNQYHFYTNNNFEKLKIKFSLINVYWVNFNRLSLNKKIVAIFVILLCFGLVLEQLGYKNKEKTVGEYWAAMSADQKEATCKSFLFASDLYVNEIIRGGDFSDFYGQWKKFKEEVAPGSETVVLAMVSGIDKHKDGVVKSYLRNKTLFITTMAQFCMSF